MIHLKKDTLHIGTVKEFKEKHRELLNKVTNEDSISIRFIDKNTKYGLSKPISIPVNW